jgi:DNA excision repair protein ERCC-4
LSRYLRMRTPKPSSQMELSDIILVQDSREQIPYGPLFQTPYVVSGLDCGDYSVAGLEHLISIERKSLQDLLGSLTNGRDRFESELKRARSLHKFYVLVECSPGDILVDDFGKLSRAHPRSIWGTICAWSTRLHLSSLEGTGPTQHASVRGCLWPMRKNF